MLEPNCVLSTTESMTDSSIKVELYDAAVCVLRESSSTAVEECIHEVGGAITEYQGGVRPGVGTGEHFLAVVDTAEGARCFREFFSVSWLYC